VRERVVTLSPTLATADRRNAIRILLVEDSDTIRRLTAEYLRCRGHEVIDVESAECALDRLRQGAIDLLFTDVSLPGMSGSELVGIVQRLWPTLPILVSSGFDLPAQTDLPGGIHFLAKPYDLTQLDRAVDVVTSGDG